MLPNRDTRPLPIHRPGVPPECPSWSRPTPLPGPGTPRNSSPNGDAQKAQNRRPCGRPRKQVVVSPLLAPGAEAPDGDQALGESAIDIEVENTRAMGAGYRSPSDFPYHASFPISSSDPSPQLSQAVSTTWQDDGLDPFDQSPLRHHHDESGKQNGDEPVAAARNDGQPRDARVDYATAASVAASRRNRASRSTRSCPQARNVPPTVGL